LSKLRGEMPGIRGSGRDVEDSLLRW